VADAEHLVRFPAGVEHALRAGSGHCERLFAKELLARGQNLETLSLMHLMWGGEDNAVDVGARQGSVEIGKVSHPWFERNVFMSSDANGSTPWRTAKRGLFFRQLMICLPHHPRPTTATRIGICLFAPTITLAE
jgi:hypothetical protein